MAINLRRVIWFLLNWWGLLWLISSTVEKLLFHSGEWPHHRLVQLSPVKMIERRRMEANIFLPGPETGDSQLIWAGQLRADYQTLEREESRESSLAQMFSRISLL